MQTNIFENPNEPFDFEIEDGAAIYYSAFLDRVTADQYLKIFLGEIFSDFFFDPEKNIFSLELGEKLVHSFDVENS